MATLSKHGEIGQLERVAHKVAYCRDGQILRNNGDGWKVWKRLKPEFAADPEGAFERARARYQEKLSSMPAFAAWRAMMHELVPFKARGFVLTAISVMPDDPEGVWSHCEDLGGYMGLELSVEDCVQLCRAYQVAQAEGREKAQGAVEAAV